MLGKDANRIALKFTVIVVLVTIFVLLTLILPAVNLIVFFVVNGYFLSREYFELAALRHLPADQVKALRKAHRGRISLSGLVIMAMVSVSLLNLLTPFFASAFMVYTFKDLMEQGAAAGGAPAPTR